MDPGGIYYEIGILVFLFILSAFFAGAETALISYNKIKLKHLIKKRDKKAIIIGKLLEEPDKLLTTLLVGNNLVNVFATSLSTAITIKLFDEKGIFIATVFIAFVILIFCEITPKSIAAANAEKISSIVCTPVHIVSKILFPLIWILNAITRLIMKIFKVQPYQHQMFTAEEFNTMIEVGKKEGVFKEEEQEMLQGIVKFSNKQVREILKTPRMNIVGIPHNANYQEIKQIIVTQQFSRYPVYKDSLDNIIGVLYAKELFTLSRDEKDNHFDVTKVMRKNSEVIFVPETNNVELLFKEMKKKRTHMAIVLEEYCGTLGIITLEDIIETIVGEIQDETDIKEENFILDIRNNIIEVNPLIPIHFINDKFKIKLPNGDIETLSGFIMKYLGRIPKQGEKFQFENLNFTISLMKDNVISIVRIEKIE